MTVKISNVEFAPTISDRDILTIGSGNDDFVEDMFLKNGMVIDYPGEGKMIRARPGVGVQDLIATGVYGSPGTPVYGQGVFTWENTGSTYTVVNGVIYKDAVALNDSFPYLGSGVQKVEFETWLGNGGVLVMKNSTDITTIDSSDNIVHMTAPAWVAYGSYVLGQQVLNDTNKVYICTTAGIAASSGGPTGTGTGITDNNAVWDYVETVTGSANIPSTMVPGIVALDQFLFVADSNGLIYNSNVADIYTWTAGDTITAELLSDNVVGIARHSNYITAVGSAGTEFLYNAANPNGSPLSRLKGTFQYIGGHKGHTLANLDDNLVWVSKNQSGTLDVCVLKGFEYKLVGTPAIISALNKAKDVYAFWEAEYYNLFGKQLYVLSIAPSFDDEDGHCFVYDLKDGVWYTWTWDEDEEGTRSNSWPFRGATTPSSSDEGIMTIDRNTLGYQVEKVFTRTIEEDRDIDAVNGSLGDITVTIRFSVQSGSWAGDTPNNKFVHRAEIVGDSHATDYSLKWQDEDKQSGGAPVYSATRTLSVDNTQGTAKSLTRLGVCKSRRWHLSNSSDAGKSRIRGLRIWYSEGTHGNL